MGKDLSRELQRWRATLNKLKKRRSPRKEVELRKRCYCLKIQVIKINPLENRARLSLIQSLIVREKKA